MELLAPSPPALPPPAPPPAEAPLGFGPIGFGQRPGPVDRPGPAAGAAAPSRIDPTSRFMGSASAASSTAPWPGTNPPFVAAAARPWEWHAGASSLPHEEQTLAGPLLETEAGAGSRGSFRR